MLDDGAMVRRPCVLLVDPGVGSGLAPLVERCGFKVLRSSTPEAALFEIGQHDFDAVVAALPLPGSGRDSRRPYRLATTVTVSRPSQPRPTGPVARRRSDRALAEADAV
jgi:hypothetical protein